MQPTRYMFLLAFCALTVAERADAATPGDFLFRNTAPDNSGMPYRLFVPPDTLPAKTYPLIVFLHGSGEAGTDNTSQLNNGANGAMQLVSDANLAFEKTFMAAPQCPHGDSCWANGISLAQLNTMIDRIAADYAIDPDRIHVTGLSMGGNGTWSLALNRPDRFASAVPMSGYGGGNAANLSAIAFWYFHAANDGTVDVTGSRNQVNGLRVANARVIYTEYATGNHGIWQNAYATPLLFRWIMAQRRGQSITSSAPVVRIEQPSTSSPWTTDLASVTLSGSAANGSHPINAMTWSRRNGPSGSTTGTTIWSTSAIALLSGANEIDVVAAGPSYYANYGGATTFNANLRVIRGGALPQPGGTVFAINSGGAAYLAFDGTSFLADSGFEGGDVQVSNRTIANTADPTLYNSWRWGNFAYRVAVANGSYDVDLHVAETCNSGVGQRRFNVALQGQTILSQFDISATAGLNGAHVRDYRIDVSGGEVLLQVSNGNIGNARLDAVQIRRDGFDPG
ncbi:MAG: malectin domain-containing carbohydrate-binding protein [Dokdonella sp.]